MGRERHEERAGFSPTQRKACVVLALCALAIVMSILAAWVLPSKLGLFSGSGDYDPNAYPLDTSLGCILPQSSSDDAYITASVFAGDQYAVTLQKDSRISLNQFVGQEGLKVSQVLQATCVNFTSDPNSYTIVQAVPKMKARRVFVQLGSNDVDGSVSVDAFIADYKQLLQNLHSAYSYADIIAVAIPPVTDSSTNAAQTQTTIDQFNQAIASACNEMGFQYLNSAEVLKNSHGFAESSYFESNGYSTSGARVLLEYAKSHAYNTMDSRPDTSDIPQRASQSSASGDTATPTPTATPVKLTASYEVEDSSKGTLSGNGQTGVPSVEFEVESGASVNVTAVAAEGFVFYKWSDGVTTATRYDNVTKDISVKAMFNDARVDLALDKGDTTMKVGDSLTVNATVKLGNKSYDATNVQWSINDEMEKNGSSLTFTPVEAGTYTIKAGIEINGTFSTAQLTVTVKGGATTVAISYSTNRIEVGGTIELTAAVQNGSGDTTWSCDGTGWSATGNTASLPCSVAGTYTVRAKNNGAESSVTITVVDPTPTTSPVPAATPVPDTAIITDSTAQ